MKIHVEPKQAYVFVDGKAVRDGSQTIFAAIYNLFAGQLGPSHSQSQV